VKPAVRGSRRESGLVPVCLVAALAVAGCGPAPVLRDYQYTRPYSGEKRLATNIQFAAGRLDLGQSSAGRLFELDLEYDASRFRPIGDYIEGSVQLGTETIDRRGVRVAGFRFGRRALAQTARIGLAAEPDHDLELLLGATEASLDLGGLRISTLRVTSGASRTALSFAIPNPGSCSSASLTSGAGAVTVAQAGNSGCRDWDVDGGVGKITIDLRGDWPADARMSLNVAVGGVTFVAPEGLGIRLEMNGFLARFDGDGFTRNGRTYTSAGYDQAERRIDLVVHSAIGGVRIEWK